MKMRLVRKYSGKSIRKQKREAELHPYKTEHDKKVREETYPYQIEYNYKRDNYENKGLYNSNKPKRRHIENPNVYAGEESHLKTSLVNLRVPSKKRKNAWKRFNKNFPFYKPGKAGKIRFVQSEVKHRPYFLKEAAKKILSNE